MKIYTKTGDKGLTSLFSGERVNKNNIRIEAYGTIDELNANLALIIAYNQNIIINEYILLIQNQLFCIGSELAISKDKLYLENGSLRFKNIINIDQINILEKNIDDLDKKLNPLTNFILPSPNKLIAQTHIARTICRRAERIIISLNQQESIRQELIIYINRLSDYLFVLARFFAKDLNIKETIWKI